jgi:3-deoxy-manno-octulosonate cytidylyltransferase (CMP-KDO synthetase)
MILDCTLRDGGYYTNWNFDISMVKDMIKALDYSGIDVIELGYKSPLKGGKFRKCNDKFIWELLDYNLPEKSKLAFMVDAKDFIKNNNVDYKLIDDVIQSKKSSPFSIARIAIKHSEISIAFNIAEYIKSKGYDLIVNLMSISLLSENEILDFSVFSKLNPISLYFADSYGNLEPAKVIQLVETFKKFKTPVGFHAHDNLGLAFANSISAMNSGAEWIDTTLLGMGRGVGNVKTEQLVTYSQYKFGNYNSEKIKKVLSDWMIPLKEKYKWGFTDNYMISGLKNIHPLYPQTLQSSFLDSNKIQNIILNLENPTSFEYDKIKDKLNPKVAVIIPARYKSSRFPGKPLAKIKGKEMIIWVAEIAEKAVGHQNVFIATENEEIVDVVKSYGYKVILTSDSCQTGTDRVAEASLEIDADIIVNIQGDEPLLNPSDILKVIESKILNPNHIINCMAYLNSYEKIEDKKIPKVITSLNDELIYISRNPIPATKFGNSNSPKKQVCIYAFTKQDLKLFSSFEKKTPIEFEEDIEIIRFLEIGRKIKMIMLDNNSHAVDYPEDIEVVEKYIK